MKPNMRLRELVNLLLLMLASWLAVILLIRSCAPVQAATPSEENLVAVIVARLPIPDSELARAVAARTLLNVIEATASDPTDAALAAIDLAEGDYWHGGGEAFIRRLDQAHATVDAIESPDSARHYLIAPSRCAHGTRLLFAKPDEYGPDFARRVGAISGACQIGRMAAVP